MKREEYIFASSLSLKFEEQLKLMAKGKNYHPKCVSEDILEPAAANLALAVIVKSFLVPLFFSFACYRLDICRAAGTMDYLGWD